MKTTVFLMYLLCCFAQQIFAKEIKILVYGKGGIVCETDGTNKVCPTPSGDACAYITMPSSIYAEYNDGVIDVMNVKLTYKGQTTPILVRGFSQVEVDHRVLQVYESPEFHAYKEYGIGRAIGMVFNWTEPVVLDYPEEDTETIQPIKITMHGSGGVTTKPGSSPVVCPLKDKAVCAVVEGSLWDLLCYWLRTGDTGEDSDSDGKTPPKALLTVYENNRPVFTTGAWVMDVNTKNTIDNNKGVLETEASTFSFKFSE